MKVPGVLRYLISLAILSYLIIAFSVGGAIGIGIIARPFQDYGGRPNLIGIILAIATIAGILYLAYLPIRYINKKTNFFKDNFPG